MGAEQVLAERERCALLVEQHADDVWMDGVNAHYAPRHLATLIRKPDFGESEMTGESDVVSGATFDILESMAKDHPELRGGYARSTQGVDIDLVVAVFANEIRRLKGLVPELPPYPPEGHGLPRYGLRWNGPDEPLAVPMDDGYWTPHHLAARQLRAKL